MDTKTIKRIGSPYVGDNQNIPAPYMPIVYDDATFNRFLKQCYDNTQADKRDHDNTQADKRDHDNTQADKRNHNHNTIIDMLEQF